jgi:hypothetical protein
VQERETRGYMQSPAARSSSFSRKSRWSGVPARTVVSQVPQVPCRQEDSTSTPAAATASSTETSGVTVTNHPRPAGVRVLRAAARGITRALTAGPAPR